MAQSTRVRQRTKVVAVGGFTSLAAIAGVASAAWACTAAAPVTSISPKVGQPGAEVRVAGTNYAAGPVEIRWNGATGPVLATAQGPSFSQVVNVPADMAGGMYYMVAVQRNTAGSVVYKVADTFEVSAPAASAATPSVSSASATGDLWSAFAPGAEVATLGDSTTAATGADSSTSRNLALGVGLMGIGTAALLGGFAVAVARRRRATAEH